MLTKANLRSTNDLSSLFDGFYGWPAITKEKSYDFDVDIIDNEGNYKLKAYLPGIDKEKVNVEYEDGVIKITANIDETEEEKTNNYSRRERKIGQFTRSFKAINLDAEKIEAVFSNGVLTVTVPKKQKPTSKIKIN